METGGHEFSVDRLAGCRSPFTESTSLKICLKLESSRIKLVTRTDVSDFTDQLMTPYLSGGSTVHLVETGGHEFSVDRLAGCRSPFTESTLTALGVSQPAVECTFVHEFENANSWKTRKNPPHRNTPRNPHQPIDRDHLDTARYETRPTR